MAKLTLDEKRLQALRRQLLGSSGISTDNTPTRQPETSYLRSDLFRILILSSAAFLIQIALYFASKQNILK